jgi:hypothetical protein
MDGKALDNVKDCRGWDQDSCPEDPSRCHSLVHSAATPTATSTATPTATSTATPTATSTSTERFDPSVTHCT